MSNKIIYALENINDCNMKLEELKSSISKMLNSGFLKLGNAEAKVELVDADEFNKDHADLEAKIIELDASVLVELDKNFFTFQDPEGISCNFFIDLENKRVKGIFGIEMFYKDIDGDNPEDWPEIAIDADVLFNFECGANELTFHKVIRSGISQNCGEDDWTNGRDYRRVGFFDKVDEFVRSISPIMNFNNALDYVEGVLFKNAEQWVHDNIDALKNKISQKFIPLNG